MLSFNKCFLGVAVLGMLLLMNGVSLSATACSYYASPTGTGNGISSSSPFKISNFWSVAGPGKTLCLLDGVYTGTSSMIKPPSGLKGTSSGRITITALNDGNVTLNGQGAYQPISLTSDNDWFIIEGINAHDSNIGVVEVSGGSDNNIIRRVVAWNCPVSGNCAVISTHDGTNNLFEDVAGFGTGRKIFSCSQSQISHCIFRRSWGAWTKTTNTVNNPKMASTMNYNNYYATFENDIFTFHEEDAATNPSGNRYGMFVAEAIQNGVPTADKCAHTLAIGGIAYLRGADPIKENMFGLLRGGAGSTCITFEHMVAYVEPGTHSGQASVSLRNLATNNGGPVSQSVAQKFVKRNTWIGGDGTDTLNSEWQVSGTENVTTVGAASNIWNGSSSSGARVCKRYVNGSLTNDPLWPWPMDQRINAALKASGRNPADYFRGTGNTVTSEMETIFGTIPAECKSTASTASTGTAPSAPSSLIATP